MPVFTVAPESFSELDEDHWYFHDTDLLPTPNSLIEHMKIINSAKLDHPIILDEAGRVMDGMHRICKAILQEVPEISAVQFQADPVPDFVNCNPKELPYDA
jgi:hypothetical protein